MSVSNRKYFRIGIVILGLYFFNFGGNQIRSQPDSFNDAWRWVQFTTESGLPSNHLNDLVESRDGTPWAATSGGLAYYDGFRWNLVGDTSEVFQHSPTWIVPDVDGGVLAIFKRRLYKCAPREFRLIPLSYHGKQIFIDEIAPTESSGYILGSDSLYEFNDGKVTPASIPFRNGSMLGESFIFTKSGTLWLNTTRGLFRRKGGEWMQIISVPSAPIEISSLIENTEGSAIFSIVAPFGSRGLWEWGETQPICAKIEEGGDVVRAMDAAPDGLLVAVYQSGIRTRRGSVWSTLSSVPAPLQDVLFVRFRQNGDLWVANERGLFLYKRSSLRWRYWIHPPPDLRNTINDIFRTGDGSIWIATASGLEIHKPDGSVQEIAQIHGARIINVTTVCEDKEGKVWIGSGSGFKGVYQWDGMVWRYFGDHGGLGETFIHRIKRDRQDRLWLLGIGSSYVAPQPGAFVYDHGTFTRWDTTTGLLSGRVYSFAQTSDGALWFGTDAGLSRWKNSGWRHWTRLALLNMGGIFTMDVDKDDQIWFADRNNGVGFIDRQDRFHRFLTSDGLISNAVWDLKFNTDGVLWASTRGGVAIYRDGCWASLSRSAGLNNLKLWPILPLENCVYIGTGGNGVDILNLQESTLPPPQLDVARAIIGGEDVYLRWKAHAFRGEVSSADIETRYRLDYGDWSPWSKSREVRLSNLSIGDHIFKVQAKSLFGRYDSSGRGVAFSIPLPFYLKPSFAIPIIIMSLAVFGLGIMLVMRKREHTRAMRASEAKFRRLTDATFEGIVIHIDGRILDINPSAATMFGYTQPELMGKSIAGFIAPGSRDLVDDRMRAMSELMYEAVGVRKDGTQIALEIIGKPLPYNGQSAQVVAIRDITERKFVEGQLLENREQLRQLAAELSATEERERRRMATYLHDTIGQALALSRMRLGVTGDVPSPDDLNEIRLQINRAIENTQSLTFDLSPPILYELNFEDAIEWLTEEMGNDHHLPIYFHSDREITSVDQSTRVLLFNAVRELLFNVVKHAQAHSAKVVIESDEGQISISVQDDGTGFNVASLNVHTSRPGGFGLFNIRERVTHLGGMFSIQSDPDQGTKVVISVPLSLVQNLREGNHS